MKASEAINVLEQMSPDAEVELRFVGSHGKSRSVSSDHPCGGAYETQSDRFGWGNHDGRR